MAEHRPASYRRDGSAGYDAAMTEAARLERADPIAMLRHLWAK